MKNMKKIFIISALVLSGNFMFAQGAAENELKNFRFGLKITPSINWYKPDGKLMSGNGAGAKFGGGLILEFRLAKVVSIQTGLQIDMAGGKIKYNNGGTNNNGANTMSYYYNTPDDKIVEYNSSLATNASHTHYQLNERQYKVTYITIPLALKMKTKEIGALTYFGHFGINSSFRWKANADDKVTVINDLTNTLGATESKSKVDVTKDVNIFAAALNFGLGAEMNLSGSTSLTFGLSYSLGFTNVVKGDSDYIARRTNGPNYTTNTTDFTVSKMPQTIKSNAVVLTVGVLF